MNVSAERRSCRWRDDRSKTTGAADLALISSHPASFQHSMLMTS